MGDESDAFVPCKLCSPTCLETRSCRGSKLETLFMRIFRGNGEARTAWSRLPALAVRPFFREGASIEDALRLLRVLPIDSLGRPGRRIASAIATKDEVLEKAARAMKGDEPQGEIVLCALSTQQEIAATLDSWRQVVVRTV
jgi:hypothetical protein